MNSGILEIASNRIQPKKATWGWERGMSGDIERFSSKNLRLLKMIIKISNKLVDDYTHQKVKLPGWVKTMDSYYLAFFLARYLFLHQSLFFEYCSFFIINSLFTFISKGREIQMVNKPNICQVFSSRVFIRVTLRIKEQEFHQTT